MPEVHIRSESDIPQGWRYLIEIVGDDGTVAEHRLRLAWVDHNHWTGERSIPPSRVAQALVESLVEAGRAGELPERFDASTARRWLADADEAVRSRL